MKLVWTLTAVRLFFQGLLDESPHSLAFAIQHWGGGGFDGDPGLPNALQSMSTAMSQVLELLNLAQSIRGENEGVHVWLMDLKDAAYAADDLLSELDYYRLHQQVEASEIDSVMKESASCSFSHLLLTDEENQASTSSPSQYPSLEDNRSKLVPRMNENVRRLGSITADLSSVLSLLKPVEDLRPIPHDSPVESHRMTTSFSPSKQTMFGRDSERDQIIKLLLLPTPTSVSMIPIVGMGGIGKTTLARMVFNHEEIKRHFDHRIWVCVSDNFDVARLTREILEYVSVDGHTTDDVNALQELKMEKLRSERYLLVLDDVWNDSEEDKWVSLFAVLQSQKARSRILMTTRLDPIVNIAAKYMDMLDQCQLGGLPEEKCLSLFNICAFGGENPNYLSLEIIGKQIAARLKGSPLAAKTMGGLLRDHLDEDHWRSVLNSDIWQLPQTDNDIMPVLQLSYQHLPPNLQQCFIYCSVFPKNRRFVKDEMVGMWISQGYVHAKSRGNKSVEEIGSEYFDNLLSRSFIQAWDERKYVLHDLLHDLAEFVSENEYLEINLKQRKEITSSVRHLHVHSKDVSLLKSCNLGNLRTLIIYGNESDDCRVLKEVLNGLKSIRVLILNDVSGQLLSSSIGHLTHLRYLAACNNKIFRDVLVFGEGAKALTAITNYVVSLRPYHLQWLISGEDGLALPAATKYLVSLRHFGSVYDLFSDAIWNEISLMSGIRKLTCLQELKRFSVGKTEGRKLAELKRLNELKGTLRLSFLDNVSTKEAALEANLNKKVGIRELVLDCGNGHATAQMAEEVFEGLCPPPNIEKLRLQSYLGVESPTWMMMTENRDTHSLFPGLRELIVKNCQKLKRVPMQCLASVEMLKTDCMVLLKELESLTSLKVLIVTDCGEMQSLTPLPASLVTLVIKRCSQLQALFTTEMEAEMKLPSLREISIESCDQLESVDLKNLPFLQKLRIEGCDWIQSVPLLPATLVELEIKSCYILTGFSREQEENLSDLTSLRKITIKYCDNLDSLPLMPASLQQLEITFCPQLRSLPLLPASLLELSLHQCFLLHSLPLMPASLQQLKVTLCPQFHSLPPMPACLQKMKIKHCPELPRERYREGGDDWHKISHVPTITWDYL